MREIGEGTVRLLIQILKDGRTNPQSITLPHTLMIRSTTAPAPTALSDPVGRAPRPSFVRHLQQVSPAALDEALLSARYRYRWLAGGTEAVEAEIDRHDAGTSSQVWPIVR